jgi:hypothetical protein
MHMHGAIYFDHNSAYDLIQFFSFFYHTQQKVYLGCHLVIALLAFLLVILPVEI